MFSLALLGLPEVLGAITGKIPTIIKWQLLIVLKIDALLSFFNIRKRSLYKANVSSVFKNLVYDNSKIKKAVEIEFTPIVEVIKNVGFFFTKQY